MTDYALVFVGLAIVIAAITLWDVEMQGGEASNFALSGVCLFLAGFFYFVYPHLQAY
jgi:hypothetical protein